MIVHRCPQRTHEWRKLRESCLVTASEAGAFLINNDQRSRGAREKRIVRFLTQDAYRYGDARLLEIREKEQRALDYNLAIQRGNAFEDQAREAFEKRAGVIINPVGLITTDDGLFGGSPDGLIGEAAGYEAKVPLPETHRLYILEHHRTGQMIEEYLHQVHFNLAVSERETWWFHSHSVKAPEDCPAPWIEDPALVIEVRRNKVTDQILAGMEVMRREFEMIRDILASKKEEPHREGAAA